MSVTDTKYEPAILNTGATIGDDFSLAFVFVGPDGTVVDITGADVEVTLKTASGALAWKSDLNNGLRIDSVDFGEAVHPIGLHWTIDKSDTSIIGVGRYQMKIRLTIEGLRRTYVKGFFTMEA